MAFCSIREFRPVGALAGESRMPREIDDFTGR